MSKVSSNTHQETDHCNVGGSVPVIRDGISSSFKLPFGLDSSSGVEVT